MVNRSRRNVIKRGALFTLSSAVLAACGQSFTQVRTANAFPPGLFDPTESGDEPLPEGYFLSWGRDQITPVYEPTFVGASEVRWPDDEIVIGVDINGQQRAYPVGFLSNRELVIDQIDDIPILVSW